MKNYIGTKSVKAEKMREDEAIARGFARQLTENREYREGYCIEYEDGYRSWSPASVFEKAYKIADTFLDRLKIEECELASKLQSLNNFLTTEAFKKLDDINQYLLTEQAKAMNSYSEILSDRIRLAK